MGSVSGGARPIQSAGSRSRWGESGGFLAVSGHRLPHLAPTAADDTRAGLPWFAYFDDEHKALEGAAKLAGLDSVAARSIKTGAGVIPDNGAIGAPDSITWKQG